MGHLLSGDDGCSSAGVRISSAGGLAPEAGAPFAGGLDGLAVDITVVDAGVVRWLAGLRAPGLLAAMHSDPPAH